jgi:hypothetical protein
LREQVPGRGVSGVATTGATQGDVLERHLRLDAEGVGMLLQESLELRIGRGYRLRRLLGEEL